MKSTSSRAMAVMTTGDFFLRVSMRRYRRQRKLAVDIWRDSVRNLHEMALDRFLYGR
jgi:hypothetical protein